MARKATIQLFRGTSTTSTETLAAGEPYFNTATGDLVIGDNTTVQQIVDLVNSNKIIPNINTILEIFNIPIFDANELNFNFDDLTYTASVKALPNGAKYTGNVIVPKQIYNNKKIYTVTSIRIEAFKDCNGLTSITIPDSVRSIGIHAFKSCTGLTSVTIPEGVTTIEDGAFFGCSGLKSITIPNSVTIISGGAFNGCTQLTSITIPDSVTTIGEYAFSSCSSLTAITIPDSVTSIGSSAFQGCSNLTSITIPEGVTSIGDRAFAGCSGLTSITIPEGVTSIEDFTFSRCGGLTSITIPDSVTSIGWGAFSGCSSLESMTIPFVGGSKSATSASASTLFGYIFGTSSYTGGTATTQYYSSSSSSTYYIPSTLRAVTVTGGNILYGAFYGCSKLTSVSIGNSVASIGEFVFYGCSKLTSLIIPFVGGTKKTPNDTDQYPFGYIFGTSSYTDSYAALQTYITDPTTTPIRTANATYYIPTALKSVVVTGGNILYGAFRKCNKLTSITIPDSVPKIGQYAFSFCSGLTSINIPDSVTSIEGDAFYGCSGLTTITIPDSVTSIGGGAFEGCTSINSVTIGSGVTYIEDPAFNGCASNLTIYMNNSYITGKPWRTDTSNTVVKYIVYGTEPIADAESQSNKVTSISSSSTDIQYPSAKCVYDIVGNIDVLLTALNTGSGV